MMGVSAEFSKFLVRSTLLKMELTLASGRSTLFEKLLLEETLLTESLSFFDAKKFNEDFGTTLLEDAFRFKENV
jgi:hypothetical protein